jgi:hypothetical protein
MAKTKRGRSQDRKRVAAGQEHEVPGLYRCSSHVREEARILIFQIGNVGDATFGGQSMILIALLAVPLALTSVEFCSAAPQPPATEPPEWHWRMVDGKKCYFRADKLLPREDLVWSYDAKKLDLDEGATVRGQRHYAPQELKAIAIERQMREDDRAPPKRKKIRGRPSRDNDDDD